MSTSNSGNTRNMVYAALFTALTFLATRFLQVPGPIPPGYINLGDAVLLIAASMLSPGYAFGVGALGSALADVSLSYWQFAPGTFVIKGLEALVAALVFRTKLNKAIGAVISALVMVAGYFVYEAFVLGLIDKTFGLTYAVTEFPFNIIQAAASVIVFAAVNLIVRRFARNKI